MLKTFLVMAAMVAIPVMGFGQTNDPHIGVTPDGVGPLPVTEDLNVVQPDLPNCDTDTGCSLIFVNNTNDIVDALTFDTSFSFTPPEGTTYTCSSPYFITCTAILSDNNGVYDLDYSFYGVDPLSMGDPTTSENPNGNPEGILPGDTFYITLAGWTGNFETVTLTNTYSLPEASTVLIFLAELLFFLVLARLYRLRWNRSWRAIVNSDQ